MLHHSTQSSFLVNAQCAMSGVAQQGVTAHTTDRKRFQMCLSDRMPDLKCCSAFSLSVLALPYLNTHPAALSLPSSKGQGEKMQ